MSHHLDTPLARQNGQLYIDDLYVFPGDRSTVFIMNVNSTVTGPDVQPGFHPEARYEFKIHVDGADFESLTYRVTFGEPDPDGRQALQLYALTADDARGDDGDGTLIVEGRTGEAAAHARHPHLGRADRRPVLHRPGAAHHDQLGHQERHGRRRHRLAGAGREQQFRRTPPCSRS